MIDSIKQRILSLLNEHVPEDLAIKGINKISPEIGSFLKKGVTAGLPLAQGLNFLRSKFSGQSGGQMENNPNQRPDERASMRRQQQSENETSNIKQAAGLGASAIGGLAGGRALGAVGNAIGNAIGGERQKPQEEQKQKSPTEDFSFSYPDMFNLVKHQLDKGKTPEEIDKLLRNSPRHEKEIGEIEKNIGEKFIDYLHRIFGIQRQNQQNNQPQQSQPQQGQGNQALLAAIEKIMKM